MLRRFQISQRERGLVLLALIGSHFSVAQAPDAYLQAQAAYTRKDFREAARLFAAAAAGPESATRPHPDALLMQSRSLVNLGDFPAAEPVLRNFLAREPRSSPGLYLLGYVLQKEDRPRESLDIFTRAATVTTPHPEDLRLVALDYVLLDDYVDAIHWLTRTVAGDPNNAEAWYDLGRAQMHEGDFVASEQSFKRTLAIDPVHSKALDNLGLSYEGQNRTDEALDAYTRAIEAQKGSQSPTEQPLLNFGSLLNTQNRSLEAIAPLQQAVALAPSSSRCHEELSRAYGGAHQKDLARKEMELAVALQPSNPRLHFQLGQIYRHAGLPERGQVELNKSAEMYSTHSSTTEIEDRTKGESSNSDHKIH